MLDDEEASAAALRFFEFKAAARRATRSKAGGASAGGGLMEEGMAARFLPGLTRFLAPVEAMTETNVRCGNGVPLYL